MWLDSKAVNCPQKWGNFNRPSLSPINLLCQCGNSFS